MLQALNPAIYLISLLPGIGVQVLVGNHDTIFPLILASLAVVALQHAINLLNDVSDWQLGADTEKYDSWVRFHHQDTRIAAMHGWISFLLGGLLGLAVLLSTDRLWILAVASPMLVLGYLYNSGPRPLSYTHLGEWVTGLCYGPGVFGCLWLLGGTGLDLRAVLGMTAFAALAMGLLLSHQPPQIETDRRSGKHSFAVRYGAARTRQTARLLFTLFLTSFGAALWLSDNNHATAAIYSVTALLAGIGVVLLQPRPVVILVPSALLMLLTLLAPTIPSLPGL